MDAIRHFGSVSSLKFQRTNIPGINVSDLELNRMGAVKGCKIGKVPFRYLSLPIGASMSKEANWISLYDKVKDKLSAWKEKCLSIGGRMTLCKSVLGSLGPWEQHGPTWDVIAPDYTIV